MNHSLIAAAVTVWFFASSCSNNEGSAGTTVGSETTNAYLIVTSNNQRASLATVVWVAQKPNWIQSYKNNDSLWILKAYADSSGLLAEPPILSIDANIFIHYENQSLRISEFPSLLDTIALAPSGVLNGKISGSEFPTQICLEGTRICSSVDSVSGEFQMTGVPAGTYEMVGIRLDSLQQRQLTFLGSADIESGDSTIIETQASFEVINLFDYTSIHSPLAKKLGMLSGFGYVVFDGDIQVDVPEGTDSIKPDFSKFLSLDSGRADTAFRISMTTGPAFHFFHAGAKFDPSLSFKAADSVRFWAKGDCQAEIKFFEGDETNLAATHLFTPDSTWKQFTLPTSNFKIANNKNPSDSLLNWQSIHRNFNHFVFASFRPCKQLWVDDLELIGISVSEILP